MTNVRVHHMMYPLSLLYCIMKRYILIPFILLFILTEVIAQDEATIYIVREKKDFLLDRVYPSHYISINDVDISEILPNSYIKLIVQPGKIVIKDSYTQKNYEDKKFVGTSEETSTLFMYAKQGEEYYVNLNLTLFDVKLQLPEKTKELKKLISIKDNSLCMAAFDISDPQTNSITNRDLAAITQIEESVISEVDKNIPINETTNNLTFAVIVANENYQEVAKVPFAIHDGEIFAQYCVKTLGIPSDNIHFIKDATYNNFRRQIDWILNVVNAYSGEASVLLYYAGHGIPDEDGKTAYLLPIDGYGNDVNSGYGLNELYKRLGQSHAKRVTIFLDACFSGANRDGDMLVAARGVAREVKPTAPQGNNMVVFSAAQGNETAYPYKEEGHGLFTYFILKKLQETAGNVTYGDLCDYIVKSVSQQSIVVNGKSQTPNINSSTALGTSWKNWNLK